VVGALKLSVLTTMSLVEEFHHIRSRKHHCWIITLDPFWWNPTCDSKASFQWEFMANMFITGFLNPRRDL